MLCTTRLSQFVVPGFVNLLRSLLVVVLVAIAACADPQSTKVTPAQAGVSAIIAEKQFAPASVPTPPQVDPEKLFQHIEALNFERYESSGRARSRNYLAQTLKDYGWQPQFQNFERGINLVASRPATDPKARTILVTAHYDTVLGSPGADDNASAIATALEVARLFKEQKTARSLKIAFFDQEEQGLLGSWAFTAKPENLATVDGVINLEMLGYACHTNGCQKFPEGLLEKPPGDRGEFIGAIADQEHLPLLNAFQNEPSAVLPPVVPLAIPLKGVMAPDLLRSDHAPFWYNNIGAVMVTDTANFRNPNYHRSTDTPDTLDRTFLAGTAQQVVNAVNRLLNSQQSLTTS